MFEVHKAIATGLRWVGERVPKHGFVPLCSPYTCARLHSTLKYRSSLIGLLLALNPVKLFSRRWNSLFNLVKLADNQVIFAAYYSDRNRGGNHVGISLSVLQYHAESFGLSIWFISGCPFTTQIPGHPTYNLLPVIADNSRAQERPRKTHRVGMRSDFSPTRTM